MKLNSYMAVIALSLVLFTACKTEVKEEAGVDVAQERVSSQEVAGALETAQFEVEGMTCALGCAKMIETKLTGLEGVKKATVDFESKKAIVEFDDAKQSSETITKTVEKIANGLYKVEHMEVGVSNEAI